MDGLKHTKGPWVLGKTDSDVWTKDNLWIAGVAGSAGDGLANARIIAAAPEMLESMIKAYRELIGVSRLQDWHSDSFREVIEEMERTIESATNMKIEEVLEATARQEAER